jgi:hypothetical protein
MIGLAGAPLAWSVQIIVGYAVSAYACYPRRMPLALPLFDSLRGMLLTISAAAIALSLLSTLVAYRSWTATRAEHEGNQHAALEAGEGRTRFMALCGLVTSAGFFIALLFTGVIPLLVHPCGA